MIDLPPVVRRYVKASNAHDAPSILACFSDEAVVHDEQQTLRGHQAIADWIGTTIAKYKFHFKPLSRKDREAETVVMIEVSGTFDGSPVTLDYHFVIEGDKIVSLTID
jgi:ketosteroid isomerase-like protein